MTADEITRYLSELNEALREESIKGEITIYGGAVMCLVYDARPSTKDVGAIFKPSGEIRRLAARIGEKHGLSPDWLNDGLKGFVVAHPQRMLLDLSNLKVFVPDPDYLLAMKALAARADTFDQVDVLTLINVLKLKTPADVFAILESYYPQQQIKPATQYFIEELFEK